MSSNITRLPPGSSSPTALATFASKPTSSALVCFSTWTATSKRKDSRRRRPSTNSCSSSLCASSASWSACFAATTASSAALARRSARCTYCAQASNRAP
eukprot:2212707-Karenia_brevis.AAC.1